MVQDAGRIQGEEIVSATDQGIVNKDLRHRLAAGTLAHFLFLGWIVGDVVFDKGHIFALQQYIGPMTVGTIVLGVDFDPFHGNFTFGLAGGEAFEYRVYRAVENHDTILPSIRDVDDGCPAFFLWLICFSPAFKQGACFSVFG